MSILDKIDEFVGKEINQQPLNEDIHADISKIKKILLNDIEIQFKNSEEEIDDIFVNNLPNATSDTAYGMASKFKWEMKNEMKYALKKFINSHKFD